MAKLNEAGEKKLEKLDSAFLFIISLVGLFFTIIQVATEGILGLLEILPLLIFGIVLPFYIGYIRGAVERNSLIERARGWVYLTVGVIAYFAFFIESFGVSFDLGLLIYIIIVTFGAFSVYYLEKWFSDFFNIQDNVANVYAFYGTAVAGVGLAFISRIIILLYQSVYATFDYSNFILNISLVIAGLLTCLSFEKISRQVIYLDLTLNNKQKIVLSKFRNKSYIAIYQLFGCLFVTVQKEKRVTMTVGIILLFIAIFLPRIPILFSLLVLSSVICYSLGAITFLKSGKTDFSALGKTIPEQTSD